MTDFALRPCEHFQVHKVLVGRLLTNSYIAQPIMFSATMTGPEMEKMEPFCFSPSMLDFAGAIPTVFAVECRYFMGR